MLMMVEIRIIKQPKTENVNRTDSEKPKQWRTTRKISHKHKKG